MQQDNSPIGGMTGPAGSGAVGCAGPGPGGCSGDPHTCTAPGERCHRREALGPVGALGPSCPGAAGPPQVLVQPAAGEPPAASPPWPLALLWAFLGGLTRRWPTYLFAFLFITAATFYFKDQRLAEEAKNKPADPPPAAQQPPTDIPPNWEQMSPEELAKLGFKRVTQEEFDKLIATDSVVVEKGKQSSPGYRVLSLEGDHAFLEEVGTPGKFTVLPVTQIERKTVPQPMPEKK